MTERSKIPQQSGRPRWLDRKENVARIYRGLWVVCALLLLSEPLIHKHVIFDPEAWFGFYGWFGFFACVGLVLVAKLILRPLVKRPEDYYD